MKLLRLGDVLQLTGVRRSTLYQKIAQGLLTKQVPIGARSVAWPEHEIVAINRARISGKSDAEIKALVQELHAARAEAI